MLPAIHGLVCPMVTPFDRSGAVDHQAARRIVDFLLDHGVHVLFPGGSTGEGLLMTPAERQALAETVIDQNAGRAPGGRPHGLYDHGGDGGADGPCLPGPARRRLQ